MMHLCGQAIPTHLLGQRRLLWLALVAVVAAGCGGSSNLGDANGQNLEHRIEDAGAGSGSASLTVANYKASAPVLDDGIVTVTVDRVGCTYTNTDVDACTGYDGCGTGVANHVGLGDITVVGTTPSETVALNAPGYTYSQSGGVFRPGAALKVTATGGQFAGLATSLTGPSQVTVVEPNAGSNTDVSGGDLTVRWTGASAGDVVVTISENITNTLNVRGVKCRFRAADGSGVVPASVLRTLPEIDSLSIQTVTTTTTVDGGWTLATSATVNSVFGDGSDAVVTFH